MRELTAQFMTKNDMLYSLLKDKLLEGDYRPGERLVVADLAAQFNVSPMPVREALQRLQQDGWVEIKPHVGARVAAYDKSKYLEVVTVRRDLESLAVRLATERMRPAEVDALFSILAKMQSCVETRDLSGYTRLNRQFHDRIYECCGNQVLIDLINELIAKSSQSQSIFYRSPERVNTSLEQHRQIAEAIRNRQPEEAYRLMYQHKQEGFDLTVELLEENE